MVEAGMESFRFCVQMAMAVAGLESCRFESKSNGHGRSCNGELSPVCAKYWLDLLIEFFTRLG